MRILTVLLFSRVVQAVGFVTMAVLIALTGVLTFTSRGAAPPVLAVQITALTIASAVLVWWVPAAWMAAVRARYAPVVPYAIAAMIVACGTASATRTGGTFILLSLPAAVAAGSETSLATGCVTTGLGVAATDVTGAAGSGPARVMVGYPLGLLLGLAIGGNLRTSRLRAEESAVLMTQADQLRAEQAQVAALDKRIRITQEIHDVLAHSLSALGLQIQVAKAILTERHDQERTDAVLSQAQRIADDGLAETRRAVQTLRGQTLPLPEGLADLGVDHELRHSTAVSFTTNGEPRPLGADGWLAITRAAQESLANSATHAPGQPVEISLDYSGNRTALTVSNHLNDAAAAGRPRSLTTVDGHHGLTEVRERLVLLGGSLTAGPAGSDWAVVATVPQ